MTESLRMSHRRDSDLTARITGLEVRLARRSAEVEMLKAAVAACQADARRTPSPPATPQVGDRGTPLIEKPLMPSICPPCGSVCRRIAAGYAWSGSCSRLASPVAGL